jgi:hypothetical protein
MLRAAQPLISCFYTAFGRLIGQKVVFLSPADNSAGSVWSQPRDINQTVPPSHLGFPMPGPGRLPCLEAHLVHLHKSFYAIGLPVDILGL